MVFVEGSEQLAHRLVVRLHRAADVHEQHQPYVVAARRAEHQLDLAGILARLVDGLVEVQLGGVAAACEMAQTPQRYLHLTEVERLVGAVILEAPFFGDLHRRTPVRGAADADAGRMLPAVSERRLAARADPAATAV